MNPIKTPFVDLEAAVDTPSTEQHQEHGVRRSSLFAAREGRSLTFENIVMTTKTGDAKKHPPKEILKNLSGHVPPRKVTAIMGPSGSGKTSLLKVLTGRTGRRHFDLSGQVRLDGRIVDPTDIEVRREIAYVEQEVSIPATSTPREAIRFSARLRLDRSVSQNEIDELVDEILSELGLEGCADTMIGGGMMRGGLSGGEKKRTQCGVELVTKPNIILLDEPTSGLDSFNAEQLADVLKQIARAGAGVLITIHQPPPTVVRSIDHLILLLDGRLMYDGSIGIQLTDFFADKGYCKPDDYNIADWIITIAQSTPISELEKAGFFQQDAKGGEITMPTTANATSESVPQHGEVEEYLGPKPSVKEVLACQFSSWYDTFSSITPLALENDDNNDGLSDSPSRKNVTIPSVIIQDLPSPDFRTYLLRDGVRLPDGATKLSSCAGMTFAKNDDDSDDEGWSQNKEQSENDETETQNYDFSALNQQIEDILQKPPFSNVNGVALPKLNWSAPKDATWMNGGTMRCKTPGDIYLLLKSSDFCMHDVLWKTLRECHDYEQYQNDHPNFTISLQLVLRKWCNLHPSMEFRCFVRQHELVAISQRHHSQQYPHLMKDWPKIRDTLEDFYEEYVRHRYAEGKIANYVLDVYLDQKGRVWIVDFNCWSRTTDSLLFQWSELVSTSLTIDHDAIEDGEEPVQMRIVEAEQQSIPDRDSDNIKNRDSYDSQAKPSKGYTMKQINRVGWETEIRLLFGREMKRLRRDRLAFVVRIGSTGLFGLFYGLIYLGIGKENLADALNLQAAFGAIANILITTIFCVAQSSLLDFPTDRPIFLREYSTNHYSVIPYFLSRFSIECTVTFLQSLVQLLAAYFLMSLHMNFVTFLAINIVLGIASTSIGIVIGCIVQDPNVAAELMPFLVVPQLLFSGFFISIDLIPQFLRWAQYLCSLTYAVRLSTYYEFGDCEYETCQQLLERNGVYELGTVWYWIILLAISFVFRVTGMVILRSKASFK